MNWQPNISVIMGVYNGAKYLRESVEGILSQEYVDFEFVIVNDGSIDESENILAEYAAQDNRIRIIEQKNHGLTRALIRGCNEAKGNYIARVDVGDVMVPKRLGKQQQVLDEYPDCVFVSCHTEFCGPKWEHLWVSLGKPESNGPVSLIPKRPERGLAGDISSHPSVMFRRNAYKSVGGYREEFYFGQDWDLWYRLAEIGSFFVVPEVLYRVRIFPDCISMTRNQCQDAVAECSKGAFIARQRNEYEQPWIEKAASIHPGNLSVLNKKNINCREPGLYFIGEALRRNGDRRCRPYFRAAIRQDPLRARSYIRWIQSLILHNST